MLHGNYIRVVSDGWPRDGHVLIDPRTTGVPVVCLSTFAPVAVDATSFTIPETVRYAETAGSPVRFEYRTHSVRRVIITKGVFISLTLQEKSWSSPAADPRACISDVTILRSAYVPRAYQQTDCPLPAITVSVTFSLNKRKKMIVFYFFSMGKFDNPHYSKISKILIMDEEMFILVLSSIVNNFQYRTIMTPIFVEAQSILCSF